MGKMSLELALLSPAHTDGEQEVEGTTVGKLGKPGCPRDGPILPHPQVKRQKQNRVDDLPGT